METAIFYVYGSLIFVCLLWLALGTFICLARFNYLEDRTDEKSEPKALLEARSLAEATSDRVDTAISDLRKFREGIHSEMQRFYGIMRRNEKAVTTPGGDTEPPEEPPDEVPADSFSEPKSSEPVLTREELRQRARKAGHRI